MKVLNIDSYTHPSTEVDRMKLEVFRPLRDHKVTIELDDGAVIEAGIFELITNGQKETHACISTQAGCKFHCTFCSSGRNGFKRNLSSQEILEEVLILSRIAEKDNFERIMYMGIGEPLDNLDGVVASIDGLLKLSGLYRHNISIATVGVIPRLKQLASYNLPLRMLWVSLHAAFDEKRSQIMPVTRSVKIRNLIEATVDFAHQTSTDTWLNYMILKGFNDGVEDARMLVELLKGTENSLSLMITRPNGEVPDMIPGKIEDIYRFQDLLLESGLLNKTVRFFAVGNPVNAGCGEFIFHPVKI
jgi:23S rRNA (adenine2503-C2)-methyltransferase